MRGRDGAAREWCRRVLKMRLDCETGVDDMVQGIVLRR